MNAKELGARLLGEVEETDLHELLEDLRATLSQTRTTTATQQHHFNLPNLDHIINIFLPPPDHITTTTTSPNRLRPNHPPILELTSLTPGSGKTHLLYHLIALCVTGDGTSLHTPAAALVFDTDAKFSISRLAEIVRVRIVALTSVQQNTDSSTDPNPNPSTSPNTNTDTNINEALTTALQNIHIFRPSSLASLVSTLHSLPAYLLASPEQSLHYSGSRKIGLLVLDSASAYFWQERMVAEDYGAARDDDDDDALEGRVSPQMSEHVGHDDDGEAGDSVGHKNAKEDKDLTSALRVTQALFACPIVYTTITLSNTSNTSTNNSSNTNTTTNAPSPLQTNLPAPLSALPTSFPTLRLLCTRNTVKRFQANMGINALLTDRGARQAVVEKGGYRVDVVPGGSVWRRDEYERVGGLSLKERLRTAGVQARGFGVVIDGDGVVVE